MVWWCFQPTPFQFTGFSFSHCLPNELLVIWKTFDYFSFHTKCLPMEISKISSRISIFQRETFSWGNHIGTKRKKRKCGKFSKHFIHKIYLEIWQEGLRGTYTWTLKRLLVLHMFFRFLGFLMLGSGLWWHTASFSVILTFQIQFFRTNNKYCIRLIWQEIENVDAKKWCLRILVDWWCLRNVSRFFLIDIICFFLNRLWVIQL